MSKNFNKSLFGFKTSEVIEEIGRMEQEQQLQQLQAASLQEEIEELKAKLKQCEEEISSNQQKLQEFINREHTIAEVMITAQKNAMRIEAEAREEARVMLEKAEEELQKKRQELEDLKQTVQVFRKEFGDVLEKYKHSLDSIENTKGEVSFVPTLVVRN